MSGGRPPVCGESEGWGAELALGLLSGPERATSLSHLVGCPSCREQVDELARVADRLLLLAPEAEPPAGFESRVLAAVGSAATEGTEPAVRNPSPGTEPAGRKAATEGTEPAGPNPSRGTEPAGREPGPGTEPAGRTPSPGTEPAGRNPGSGGRGRRVGLVAALVVAAALGGGVVGSVLRSPPGPEPTAVRTGLAVSASGRVSCRVVVTGTRPASVLVSLDGFPGDDTDVTVEMETVTGETVPLGPVPVTDGHGLLVTTLDLEAKSLGLMRMFNREGKVIYEAVLHEHHTLTAR